MTVKEMDLKIPNLDSNNTLSKDAIVLRHCGFAIRSRPKKGPNIWTRGGKDFEEVVAVRIACNENMELEKAKEKK